MKRIVLAFLLAATMACTRLPHPVFSPSAMAPIPVDSIQPLQMLPLGNTICTTWSLGDGLWATAAHCALVTNDDGGVIGQRALAIHSFPVHLVFADPTSDLAVVESSVIAPAIPYALVNPATTDWQNHPYHVRLYGYAFGAPLPTLFQGDLANAHLVLDTPYVIFDLRCFGGHSGSPVINDAGEVVSVLQISITGSGFCGGAPWETLRELLPYWTM